MVDQKTAPPDTPEERLTKAVHNIQIEIKDLFQRYGHLLDRIIALEKAHPEAEGTPVEVKAE